MWDQGEDLELSGGTEELEQQGASFLLNACIVRLEKGQQVALGLESKHLDNVGEVLAFGGELDHGACADVGDLHPPRERAPRGEELGEALAGRAQLLAGVAGFRQRAKSGQDWLRTSACVTFDTPTENSQPIKKKRTGIHPHPKPPPSSFPEGLIPLCQEF